ncbi:hypothetical protein Tco_0759657 [Tanacetum coccineum]
MMIQTRVRNLPKKQLKRGNLTFKVGKVKTRSCKVGEGTSKEGEGSSRNFDVSPNWTKSKIASSRKSGQPQCGFRLWVSWISTENSFQIKSLKAEHKCVRNYNLGSLVTYKWIAHHFEKEIIEDPFIPLLKMKAAIREKFLINAILDTNPGSTCILDDEETEYGNTYFRRFYICFKGVKDVWKAVPDEGVDYWYSQERWVEAYQFSIKPIYDSNMWKKQPNKPLLPPIVVRMSGRPRKNRVKDKSENNSQPGRKREPNFNSYASNRGGGRGSRGGKGQVTGGIGDASDGKGQASDGLGEASGALGEASGGRGQANAARFQANTERGESSGGRGRARGRGGRSGMARGRGCRGQGRGGKGRRRGVTTMLINEDEMNEEEIRKNMKHEYMEQILIEEEEKRIAVEKAI